MDQTTRDRLTELYGAPVVEQIAALMEDGSDLHWATARVMNMSRVEAKLRFESALNGGRYRLEE